MAISKVRNPIFTFPTKMVRSNFAEAKKELRWKPMAEYRKQAYLGETITPVVHTMENGCAVELRNSEGEPYFIGEFTV